MYPQIIISSMAVCRRSSVEQVALDGQIQEWRRKHWNDQGFVGNSREGYAFGGRNHRKYQ
jgi:hypothetical protein